MNYIISFFLFFLCVVPAFGATLEGEAIVVQNVALMKSEPDMMQVIKLLDAKNIEAGAQFMMKNGKMLDKGAEVVLIQESCDGKCLKLRIKDDNTDYWSMKSMHGKDIFKKKE
jgi:hypothetical protein